MNFYIADTHFFGSDKLLFQYDKRPFKDADEMRAEMLKRWNAKVSNADHVYMFGDVDGRADLPDILSYLVQLKGNKHLILGNHDQNADHGQYKKLFDEIKSYKEMTDTADVVRYHLVLCHYPIFAWNGQHKGAIHLYGHVHNTRDESQFRQALASLNEVYRERDTERYRPFYAINVGVMFTDYEPKTLKELLDMNHIPPTRAI